MLQGRACTSLEFLVQHHFQEILVTPKRRWHCPLATPLEQEDTDLGGPKPNSYLCLVSSIKYLHHTLHVPGTPLSASQIWRPWILTVLVSL